MRIADAAHSVEDVIESHIVDQILGDRGQISSACLYEAVEKAMGEMEVVKKEAMDLQEKTPIYQHQLLRADSSTFAGSSTSDWPEQYTTMVGFDGIFNQLLDKLTSYESRRQIISITGMGGMGKTTLAKNIYQNQLVVERFDFRAWIKISQKYNIRKILLKVVEGDEEALGQVDEYELGNMIHKKLTGRRYFIIMDDIWDIEIWDRLRMFLPDNGNRSRIMITTRLSKLARDIDESHNMEMDILDEESSWILFSKHVFGEEEECPLELKGIGKQIVKGCKGLPLSISVVGGLLAKSKPEKQYWEEIAENLNSTVNLEDDKHCLQILYMSYVNLPLHLKPCFLFIGLCAGNAECFFPNFAIVQLLVAEGLVIPVSGKSLEEAAKQYVIELVERNLILIDKNDIDWDWMYRDCRVHDLLWDLCLRESLKQKFFYVVGEPSTLNKIPQSMDSIRRIFVGENTPKEEIVPLLESATLLRSIYYWEETGRVSSLPCSRLLRATNDLNNQEDIFQKVNLRFILMDHRDEYRKLSSMSCFWNLHMLLVTVESWDVLMAPYDIWMMPHLRLVSVNKPLCLPDPLSGEKDCSIVLKNLHSLMCVYNLKFSEEVVKRIPHVKLLVISYREVEESDVDYCLNNLGRLQQLIHIEIEGHLQNQILSVTFPRSLLFLKLSGTCLHWDDVTTKIGCLPLLQRLTLCRDSCIGAKWETTECQFNSLKHLVIKDCRDLEYWMTESSHFPRLESLTLRGLLKLKEIPSDVGHIPTLELIKLKDCCDSLYSSARRIEEEQEELGNEDLRVVFRVN